MLATAGSLPSLSDFHLSGAPERLQPADRGDDLELMGSGSVTVSGGTWIATSGGLPAGGSWNSGSNWSSGSVVSGVGVAATINAPTAGQLTITLDAPQSGSAQSRSARRRRAGGYAINAGNSGTCRP